MRPPPEVIASVLAILIDGQPHTGPEIARKLGLSRLRTVGEVVVVLIEHGWPIASRSASGYRLTSSADELERALAEVELRARRTLLRRRHLRRALAALRGQLSIGGAA